jgi:hypothetical protein
MASFLKGFQALSHYQGGRERLINRPKEDVRLDFLRSRNMHKGTVQTKVGVGTGWDEWGSGRPADDVRRRFRSKLNAPRRFRGT